MKTTFSPKQYEYIANAGARWNFKVGATRSGKTYIDLAHIIPREIRRRRGLSGLNCIIGVSLGTVERNILAPLREIHGDDLVNNVDNRNMCNMFGENVYVIGAQNKAQTAKIRGASFKYVYGDEVTEWNEGFFELLKSRLDKPYSRFDGTCNPEGPYHWLKKFIDSENIYVQYYKIDDNPYLTREFIECLKNEYAGSVYYNRYIEGAWVTAEGLVYPQFNEDYIIDEAPVNYERYVISIDYGIQNATAMLLYGLTNNIWHVINEFYYSGRQSGFAYTDEEYYNELSKLASGKKISNVIIDPSASSFIQLIRRKGEFAVKRADNDVLNGIRNTASAFGAKKLKIYAGCKHLINELANYAWDKTADTERPLKKNDHTCDALRYFIRTMKI
ncbi:MAG: PBSX family phage terminase large subunit [Defluviitaleaceae bacterium]|nr:PBSX family phage terminase large subunit [Defluviitaleaceae bacterium]